MIRAFLVLLLLTGCGDGGKLRSLYGGPAGIDILEFPDRMEVLCVRRPNRPPGYVDWMEWEPVSPAAALGPEARRRVSQFLLDPSSFEHWGEGKGHVHDVRYRLTALKENRRLDLQICFGCHSLFPFLDGKEVGTGNLTIVAWKELGRLYAEHFPDEKDAFTWKE